MEQAKPQLMVYFEGKISQFQRGELSPEDRAAFGKLLESKSSINEASRSAKLDVEDDRPCFDAAQKPVDGSIYDKHHGSIERGRICVSSYSIAQKVERHDVRAQSAALLAHELTEVLGFEEDDAVRVQARVLDDFRRNTR